MQAGDADADLISAAPPTPPSPPQHGAGGGSASASADILASIVNILAEGVVALAAVAVNGLVQVALKAQEAVQAQAQAQAEAARAEAAAAEAPGHARNDDFFAGAGHKAGGTASRGTGRRKNGLY